MSWCEHCQRQVEEGSSGRAVACPGCGARVGAADRGRIPWHFWVLVTAAAAYLGWRALQVVIWAVGSLT